MHLSAEDLGAYIACGDIVGEMTDGVLTVAIRELAGSGHSGLAWITEEDGWNLDIILANLTTAEEAPGASPMPGESPRHGESPVPDASPGGEASPMPDASPGSEPGASPGGEASSSPAA